MSDQDNKHPPKKSLDLKAATHILKREALKRYREKLRLQASPDTSQIDITTKPQREDNKKWDDLVPTTASFSEDESDLKVNNKEKTKNDFDSKDSVCLDPNDVNTNDLCKNSHHFSTMDGEEEKESPEMTSQSDPAPDILHDDAAQNKQDTELDQKPSNTAKDNDEENVETEVLEDKEPVQDNVKTELQESENPVQDDVQTKMEEDEKSVQDDVQTEIQKDKEPVQDNVITEMEEGKEPVQDNVQTEMQEGEKSVQDDIQTKLEEGETPVQDDVQIEMQEDVQTKLEEGEKSAQDDVQTKLEEGESSVQTKLEEGEKSVQDDAQTKLEEGETSVQDDAQTKLEEGEKSVQDDVQTKLEEGETSVQDDAQTKLEEGETSVQDDVQTKLEEGETSVQDDVQTKLEEGETSVQDDVQTKLEEGETSVQDDVQTKLEEGETSVQDDVQDEIKEGEKSVQDDVQAEIQEDKKSAEDNIQTEIQEDEKPAQVPQKEAVEISYNIEDYQSIPRTSADSGIPLNILQFYHSFGYDCCKRSNLYLLQGPTALFAAGNSVHLLNLVTEEHRFLRTCSGGGVGALTVHPSGKYFAVAEKGVKPGIFIYEFPSMKLHRILRGGTEKAYSFIDFNPKGNLLASVGSAPDYMLTVWDWQIEKIMLRSKAFSQEVYRVTFSPEQEGQLTSCGTTHIRFWKMAFTFTGLKLKGELGRFGKTPLGDIEGYIQLPDGKVLSGSDWGNMLLWDGGLIKVEISRKNQRPCHVGSIQQLVMDEGELITIGRDGFVRVWEMEAIDSADTTDDSDIFELEPMNELRVGNDVQLTCMIKAPQEDSKEGEDVASIWYAQDANGGIWKLDLSFSHTTKPPEKLYSYTAGPITGLDCSPVSHLMVTTGDAYVRVYDYLTKKMICHFHSSSPQTKSTCVAWPNQVVDPKGTTIVAGFSDGIIRALTIEQIESTNKLILKQAWKPHSAEVMVMAFDNSGEILATGSNDRTVFFFFVDSDRFDPIGFVKVPGEVTSMQWSPPGFDATTLLVSCSNGKVVEINSPRQSACDTSHSYHLEDVKMKYFNFQSVKSELRRDEERERKEKKKKEQREKREKELQRRKDAGEEISPEDAQAFLDGGGEDDDEEEEEPLFYPAEPNAILQAFYTKPGVFVASVDGYDAGYLYECTFPDEYFDDSDEQSEVTTRPTRSFPLQDSCDVAISCIRFTKDRMKFIAGFKNGLIRVYPLESYPEYTFGLEMLGPYWEFNMHDNDTGTVSLLAESHDSAYLFSGGGDGNVFGYLSLAHEEIIKSMEGKKAKLPTPRKSISKQEMVDDIDDPHAYSIEDAKLKAEHDKMIRDAEAKKTEERKKIEKLRKTFLKLQRTNRELPENVRLEKEEFELDPSNRLNMIKNTNERTNRVRLEMQWDKAKLELAHQKLQDRFRSQLQSDRVVVHSVNSDHTVASYRLQKLSKGFHTLRESVSDKLNMGSVSSEGGNTGVHDRTTVNTEQPQTSEEQIDAEAVGDGFIPGSNFKQKASILHGRQAEKVQKALQKAAEAKEKREMRQKEWEELNRNKPDEKYEDPADVAAIKEAQANMGDFKLKTAADYVVPEHLRMDAEKKRLQIVTVQELCHRSKSEFNKKLIQLRDDKVILIDQISSYVEEVKQIQKKMPENERLPLPEIPQIHTEEEPHRKYEYTRESLLKFEEDEKKRKVADAQKKRTGDGGLFGGFGGDSAPTAESTSDFKLGSRISKKTASVASSAFSKSSRFKTLEREVVTPTALEEQLDRIELTRSRYHRNRLLKLIDTKMSSFDAELRLLRHKKDKLDVDLKMADLREVTLIEELLLLKEYEKRENTLSGRVSSKKTELSEMLGKAADMNVKLESKRRDIDRLTDREKALYASFTMSLGENNKYTDFLNKVFKKKIKRAKKKTAAEGEEDDSDMSSSDESDYSSDEDDDESMEGGFDDSACPPGCDPQLFDSTIALREKRLDLEEALVEEKKIAETLKKDADSFSKKAKIIETQLKNALADLEAFQVEKQGKLNELDVVVPLRLHQVEHVSNGVVPNDLSPCLVFTNQSLTGLQRRIKELQSEKSEQRKLYKDARQQHVHLIKNRRIMQQKINELEEKCENMMMLKFGRVVDLEKLETVTINKTVEELKEKVRRSELRNAEEIMKRQRYIDELKNKLRDLVQDNTRRLDTLNVLVTDKDKLEQTLEKRQQNTELDDTSGRNKVEMREQHRLVQLVQLQAQEIQALKEEIGLLSRKGGHILPPAQPPLGQEQDVAVL